MLILVFCGIAATVGGCNHIQGVVLDERQRPLETAVFSVGRPDAIATYGTHKVDARGRFNFQLSAIDETNLYLYDGAGDPQATLRHIERNEMSDHMRILMRRANPRQPGDDMMKVPPGLMD
jgi:hypothetical protein